MFFIGCSLDKDRTTEVLNTIRQQHLGSYHYAFAQIPETDEKFDERVMALRTMGVRPIWYPKGEHKEIEKFLSDLVHAVSSHRLPNDLLKTPQKSPKLQVEQAIGLLSCEIGELQMALRLAPSEVRNYPEETPTYAAILDKITRGRLAFFLGSGACMGRLPLGPEFYRDLIAQFSDESDRDDAADKYGNMEPPRITQHFADKYDRETLYSQVNQRLAGSQPSPTVIHWFIASLRDRLLSKGFNVAPQWIFTMNYDDWMEQALGIVGERYHLFTYRVSRPHAGSFIYQDPDGIAHFIDRPSHFRRLPEDYPVLVKLHGGMNRYLNLPVSYAFTHRDFVELAGRIPDAIPRVILDRLAERSLLFLGSGLGDDSIESLVRTMHDQDPKKLSWAIQWQPRPEKRLYWRELGVQIVDITLANFMLELNRRLDSMNASRADSM